jgi:hypothetical protein
MGIGIAKSFGVDGLIMNSFIEGGHETRNNSVSI